MHEDIQDDVEEDYEEDFAEVERNEYPSIIADDAPDVSTSIAR